jgi:hypothetical protein
MKIDPIYLLAPEPKPPSIPTRRAFLLAGGTLLIGALAGGACGYSMGLAARPNGGKEPKPANAAAKVEEELKTSGDAELDYWRQMAVKAPLDELFTKSLMFLHVRITDYPKDDVLWRGVQRMVHEIRDNSARQVSEALLTLLASHIEGGATPTKPDLRSEVPMLRERRAALKRTK